MLKLAPDENLLKKILADNYIASNKANGWVQALIQSSIVNTIPPQDCINSIQTSFNQFVKILEDSWVKDLMPRLQSDIPQAFVSFSEEFAPIASDIGAVMDQLPKDTGNPTDKQRLILQDLVTGLLQAVNKSMSQLEALIEKTSKLARQIDGFYITLTQGAQSAQKLLEIDAKKILNLQNQIVALQQKLSDDEVKIKSDDSSFLISTGVLLYNFTIGLAINGMQGDPLLSVGHLFSSFFGVGKSIATMDADSHAVEDDVQNLADLEYQLTSEETTVAALYGVVNTVRLLEGHGNGLIASLPMVLVIWNRISDACEQLLETLNQPIIDLRLVSILSDITSSAQAWGNISQYANSLLSISFTSTMINLNNK